MAKPTVRFHPAATQHAAPLFLRTVKEVDRMQVMLAENIRAFRREKKLTQEQLAEEIGRAHV